MSRFLIKDHYFHKAKREGFRARSVFKLEEIEQKDRLFFKHSWVLDLGAAPGSWLQYVGSRIQGGSGMALGVDLTPIGGLPWTNVKTLQADAFLLDIEQVAQTLGIEKDRFLGFDVVLSDMAPKTTGIRHVDQDRSMELAERAFEVACRFLKAKGHVVIKIFEGPDTQKLILRMRQQFSVVKQCRPKGVRAVSKEFYAVGLCKKA